MGANRQQRRKQESLSRKRDGSLLFVSCDLGSSIGLAEVGPIIMGEWSVPKADESVVLADGGALPKPISGALLIDTGAASTCIAQDVADSLCLRPARVAKTYGAGGLHELPEYRARMKVWLKTVQPGQPKDVGFEAFVIAIPELNDSIERHNLKLEGVPVRLVGLLGRDFLRNGTLTYDGGTGRCVFVMDHTKMPGTLSL